LKVSKYNLKSEIRGSEKSLNLQALYAKTQNVIQSREYSRQDIKKSVSQGIISDQLHKSSLNKRISNTSLAEDKFEGKARSVDLNMEDNNKQHSGMSKNLLKKSQFSLNSTLNNSMKNQLDKMKLRSSTYHKNKRWDSLGCCIPKITMSRN
jgi:hypothetical protein